MSKEKIKEIHDKMDHLWYMHKMTRSLFPAIDDNRVGSKGRISAPYYYKEDQNFFNYAVNSLTIEDLIDIRNAGHYLNQNFIVRLHSILDSYKDKPRLIYVYDNVHGYEHLIILKRLRRIFAHETGKFDKDNIKHIEIDEEIVKLYGLSNTPIDSNEFRLRIDKVLEPMLNGCKEYVEDFIIKVETKVTLNKINKF